MTEVKAIDYSMNSKKVDKLNKVKAFLDNKGYFYDEKANGQLIFDNHLTLWATTEKWHDSQAQVSGNGINSFVKYFESKIAK